MQTRSMTRSQAANNNWEFMVNRVLTPENAIRLGRMAAQVYQGRGAATLPPFRLPRMPGRSVARNAATTQTAGRSQGGRAKGRSVGTYDGKMKVKRKFKPRSFKVKAQAKGFSIHFEKGGSVTDPYCCYVGHGSNPQVIMRRLMLGCLLKTLLNRMGMSFSNTVQPLTFLALGDSIDILIKENQENATVVVIGYTLPGAQPTFQGLLDGVVNAWITALQSATLGANPMNWKFKEIRYNPGAGSINVPARFPLENATLNYEAVSTMKVQNRSVPNDTDDQDDEVDRIPIKGYIYQFKGSGTNFKRTAASAIGEINFEPVGEKSDGIFTYSAGAAGGAVTLREPPMAFNFVRCLGHTKVYVDPGKIKMSVVKDKRSITLERLLRVCVGTDERAALSNVAVQQELGKFNMVSVEKLIETSNSTPTALINVGYEVDYKIFGYLTNRSVNNTIGESYYGSTPS